MNNPPGSVNHQANVSGNSGCIRRRLRVAKLRSVGRPIESKRTVNGCVRVGCFSAPAVHCYGGMMSDLVSTAADALLPFLATGGAAIGAGMADQAGSDQLSHACYQKRSRNGSGDTAKPMLRPAIREALADGSLNGELQQLRAHSLAQNNAVHHHGGRQCRSRHFFRRQHQYWRAEHRQARVTEQAPPAESSPATEQLSSLSDLHETTGTYEISVVKQGETGPLRL